MNKGITWTVLSCLAFMAIVLSLFISRMNTPRELSQEEYKDLGAYFIDPPRQLSGFNLIDDQKYRDTPSIFNHIGKTCYLTAQQYLTVYSYLAEA